MKRQTFTASVLLLVSFFTFFVWKVWADTSNAVNATVKISICGNNVVEGGEDCEGSDLNGKSCSDIAGFSGGTLACDISCSFDTSNCIKTTVTPTPTSIPLSNSVTSTSGPTNTPIPTKVPISATKVAKNLPALVQLFGSTETGTIPVTKLHTVMSSWVTSWRETQSPKQAPTTKTAAIATCDVNHDGVCDIRDFSVLLFYIQ